MKMAGSPCGMKGRVERSMSLIAAVLIFGLIILIHEFGHFLLAKRNGIGVLEFSLGMGPRLVSFRKGETRYSIKLLPFGGSCMMLGEDEEEAASNAFGNKSVWARISVVAAGPFFNFLLAWLLAMVLVGFTGYSEALVADTEEGYPAREAGIQAGDVVTKINGRAVHAYRDINLYTLTHPGKAIEVTCERIGEDGEKTSYTSLLEPVWDPERGMYRIGVLFDGTYYSAKSPLTLMAQGIYEVEFCIRYVFDTFYMMFRGLVTIDDLSGPVGIVSAIDSTVEEAAPYGLATVALSLVSLSILLSANLGVMNLLPIPALDGGRLVFLLLEAVRGKPIDREKEGMVHLAGMMLLMALMIFVLFNDVRKLF